MQGSHNMLTQFSTAEMQRIKFNRANGQDLKSFLLSKLLKCSISVFFIAKFTVAQSETFHKLIQPATGAALCSLDPPSLEVKVRSLLDCSAQCVRLYPDSGAFNFRADVRVRQLYLTTPSNYAVVTSCAHYQVQQ